jgi:hypothetical protein
MKKSFLVILVFFFSINAFPQSYGNNFALPTVLSPAPQSAALGRYGDIPVSINTGVLNISIPLCTISSGKLSLPISISYHASGIKVMDMASPTGLGWALNAGGDITRVVQGQPDETPYGFPTVRMPSKSDPSLPAKEICLANNMCNSYDGSINAWDGQPDLFFFSIGNKSGQFLSKNRISNVQQLGFMTIPYYPINISMMNEYQNFNITDDDGCQYFFTRYDSSTLNGSTSPRIITYATAWHLIKILSADKVDSIIFKYDTVSQFAYATNPSKLLQLNYDGLTGFPVNFSYSSPTSSTINTTEYLLSEIDFKNGKVSIDYSDGFASSETKILNAVHLFNIQNDNYIEIKRFTLYHSPFINYSATTNVSRLDSIKETGYYNNSFIQNNPTVFNYNSYGGFQCPPFNSFAQDFWGYFNGQVSNTDMDFVVPGMSGGTPSVPVAVTVPSKRQPDSNYLKVGTLQSIKYPTGGTTNLVLEANQTQIQTTINDTLNNPGAGLNIYISNFGASANSNFGFSSTFTVDTTYSNVYQSGTGYGTQLFNAKMALQISPMCTAGGTNCIYDQAFVQLNDITAGSPGISVLQLMDNSPSTTGSTILTGLFNLTKGHTYILTFPFQPELPNNSANFQNRLDANVTAQTSNNITIVQSPVTETILTGGLRVRSVSSSDMNGNILVKQYDYTGAYFNSPLFNGNYNTLATTFAFNGWKLYGTYPSVRWGNAITCYSPNLPLPLGSVSNNALSYSEVVEKESGKDGNFNGKTVYNYKSLNDVVSMNLPFFRISNENARALLTEKRIYKSLNGGYSLVQDQVNRYTDLDSGMTNADTVIFYTTHALFLDNSAGTPGQLIGQPAYSCLGCNTYSTANQYLINRYFYTTTRYELKSSIVTDIDNNGNALRTGVSYDYQNPVHAFPTHINKINSGGQSIDIYSSYVLDQTVALPCTNSCLNNLNPQLNSLDSSYFITFSNEYNKYSQYEYANNLAFNVPGITGTLTASNADSVVAYENMYAQSMTNYQSAVDALINTNNTCVVNYTTCLTNYYPTATIDEKGIMDLQVQNNILPLLQSTQYTNSVLMWTVQNYFQSFYPNVTKPSRVMYSTLSSPTETRLLFNTYDRNGNNLQVEKTNDEYHSYIWDYQNTYPIAEIQNATQNNVAYTSFEADGKGNWTFSGTPVSDPTAPTGSKCYLLTNGPISKSGLTAPKYIVSFWQKAGGTVIVSGGSNALVAGKSVNGWYYYEYTVTGATTLTMSGTGTLDELRLYPSNAQMTTYTYNPLVGMTSECDADNKITYYFYDGLGRMKWVKDQDGNIIKTLEYHYKQ